MSFMVPGSKPRIRTAGILDAATGAWRASSVTANKLGLTDLTGNGRHMRFGGDGVNPTSSDPKLLRPEGGQYLHLDGVSGNYAKVEDLNLLDSRQASFDNVGFDGTVNPEDRYEVWGTGGGTAEGAFTDASPMLIDLESYDVAAGMVLDRTSGTHALSNWAGALPSDFRVEADLSIDDLTPGGLNDQMIMAQWSSSAQGSFIFGLQKDSGYPKLLTTDGSSINSFNSDPLSTVGIVSGQRVKLAVEHVADNGSSQSIATFYYSTDEGQTWSTLSSEVQSVLVPQNSSNELSVGAYTTGTNWYTGGTFYSATLSYLDGPIVANPIFEGAHITGGVTSFLDGQGNTWTLNGNASIASGTPSQVGWLSGAEDNYFSIPDVNLLDAQDAHMESGIPANLGGNINSSWERVSAESIFGDYSLAITNPGGGYASTIYSSSATVSPGVEYTFTAFAKSPNKNGTIRLRRKFRQGGTTLSESNHTITPSGDWDRLHVTGTAPANTDNIQIFYEQYDGVAGDITYWDAQCLREGSDPTFVPSTRIVGDHDIRARYSAKTHGLNFINKWVGSNTDRIYNIRSSGDLYLNDPSDAATADWSVITNWVSGRGEAFSRWTFEGSTVTGLSTLDGESWSQEDQQTSTANPEGHDPSSLEPLRIGGLHYDIGSTGFTGAILYFELRDGIDGPIVASMDLTKMFEGNVTSSISPEGHTASLNRSGVKATQIISQSSFIDGFMELDAEHVPTFDIDTSNYAVAYSMQRTGAGHESAAFTTGDVYLDKGQSGIHFAEWTASGNGSVKIQNDVGDRYQVSVGAGVPEFEFYNRVWSLKDGGVFEHAVSWNNTTYSFSTSAMPPITATFARIMWSSYFQEMHSPMAWVAVFRRGLTSTEIETLRVWDGQVSTEPSWLRPLAVFYINANDPWVKNYYDGTIETNSVLNLATAPYGELGWFTNNNSTGITRSNEVTPVVGSMVLKSTMDAVGLGAMNIASSPIGPVSAGQAYSVSASLRQNSGATRTVGIILVWHDDEGGEIARETEVTQSVDTNTWVRVSASGVAPTGATQASIETTLISGNVCSLFIDAAVIREGADTGYVPSLRIREDVDVRVDAALDEWTAAGNDYLVLKSGHAHNGFSTYIDGGKRLVMAWTDGDATESSTVTTPLPVSDGDRLQVRMTLDVDNGSGQSIVTAYYRSSGNLSSDSGWTQLGAPTVGNPITLGLENFPVLIGAYRGGTNNPTGNIYGVVIKDGINGPTALGIDFTDETQFTNGVESTSGVVESGHEVSLEGRTLIVDRPMLYLDGVDDFLSIPDDDAFDVGASTDLTVVAVVRMTDANATNPIVFKRNNLNAAITGWSLHGANHQARGRMDDGASMLASGLGGATSKAVHSFAFTIDRDADSLNSYLDALKGSDQSGLPGDVSNANNVTIGAYGALNVFAEMEFLGAAIFVGRVLTQAQIQRVAQMLQRY